jgi:hypothetical protein
VLLGLFILQQIVINILAPRLMGHSVGLHPLLVFLAVLGGAKLAGVWGAVFGVPIVAVATAMVSFYRATVEERHARLLSATSGGASGEQLDQLDQPNPPPAEPERPVDPAVARIGGLTRGAASGPLPRKEPSEL